MLHPKPRTRIKPMRKPKRSTGTKDPLRTAIISRLAGLKCEPWWLASCPKLARTASRSTLWRYLKGSRDSTGTNIGEIIRLLGGRIEWDQDPGTEAGIRKILFPDGDGDLTPESTRG